MVAVLRNTQPSMSETEQTLSQREAELAQVAASHAQFSQHLDAARAQLAESCATWMREGLTVPQPWQQLASMASPSISDAVQTLIAEAEQLRAVAVRAREEAVRAWHVELAQNEQRLRDQEQQLNRAMAQSMEGLAHARAERAAVARSVMASRAAQPLSPITIPAIPAVDAPQLAAKPVASAAQPKPADAEQRKNPRAHFEARVDLHTDDNFYAGFSTDLSEGGIFVATVTLLPIGAQVELDFAVCDGRRVHTTGTVQWVREVLDDPRVMPGMGIRFDALDADAQRDIHGFMQAREPLFFA